MKRSWKEYIEDKIEDLEFEWEIMKDFSMDDIKYYFKHMNFDKALVIVSFVVSITALIVRSLR